MLSLKGRQDKFRLLLPDEIIPEPVKEKYTKVLKAKKSFIYKPIDFVNESIQRIQILGFSNGTMQQQQSGRGTIAEPGEPTYEQNNLMHMISGFNYRAASNPINLIDKTLNIDFRHTVGYLNYFILFESFFYQYMRDQKSDGLPKILPIDIYNEYGEVYARIVLSDPLIDGMDMLDLDFSKPVAQSQTFRVTIKYSNIDFEFIDNID